MKQKGSFTVEAAFVVPMLFLVIWIVIHIGFFLYNREAATAIAALGVLEGSRLEQEGKNTIERMVSSYVQEEIEEKLIFTDEVQWDVKVSAVSIRVTIQVSQNIPFKTLTCIAEEKISRIHPVSAIWEMERLKK